MKLLIFALISTIVAVAAYKPPTLLWNFLKVTSAEVINYRPEILNVILVSNIWSTDANSLTGTFDVKENMDDTFEVCRTKNCIFR